MLILQIMVLGSSRRCKSLLLLLLSAYLRCVFIYKKNVSKMCNVCLTNVSRHKNTSVRDDKCCDKTPIIPMVTLSSPSPSIPCFSSHILCLQASQPKKMKGGNTIHYALSLFQLCINTGCPRKKISPSIFRSLLNIYANFTNIYGNPDSIAF